MHKARGGDASAAMQCGTGVRARQNLPKTASKLAKLQPSLSESPGEPARDILLSNKGTAPGNGQSGYRYFP